MVAPLRVEVVRSARRRRTIQARQLGDVLRVHVPANLSQAEEDHWVGVMLRRFERRRQVSDDDLTERAAALARRHDLPTPASIRWVDNQQHRWGSCTPADGTIRISDRLAEYPTWVLEYVIVHELAHLVEHGHGPAFKELVNRYPRAERARGFLIAKDLELD
jgi:predicted metal-dependent hydrolase